MVEFRAARIKEFREAHDMSLEEMAQRLGKPKQLVGVWENGVNNPSLENVLLICNTFDVDPSFFFCTISSSLEEMRAN